MAITFVPYIIVLDDADQVAALNAAPSRWNKPRNDIGGALTVQSTDDGATVLGSTGKLFCGPNRALVEFPTATIYKMGGSTPVTSMPYIWSMWIWEDNSDTYPLDVDTWTQENPDFVIGDNNRLTRYIWVGTYVYGGEGTREDGAEPYSHVRWFNGFDFGEQALSGGSGGSPTFCPEASRHLGQLGMLVNESTSNNYTTMSMQLYEGASYKPQATWERLYMRVRTRPSSTFYFLNWTHSAGASYGLLLALTPTGQVAVYNQTAVGTYVLLGSSSALTYGDTAAWHKVDLIASIATGQIALYIDGVEELDITIGATGWGVPTDGFAQPAYHATSRLGAVITNASSLGECIHFDDWSCHDVPTMLAVRENLQEDFLAGTKVVRLKLTELGDSHVGAAWGTGAPERLDSIPPDGLITGYEFTSSTASSKLAVFTDINERTNLDMRRAEGGILGMRIAIRVKAAAGASTGSIAFSLDGAADVTTAVTETTSYQTFVDAYLPTGLAAPEVFETLEVKYVPGASAHLRTVQAIGVSVLIVGRFDRCDIPYEESLTGAAPNLPPQVGQQNFAYPRSPWSDYEFFPPPAPLQLIGGTYVGNGTKTELTFEYPVTFIWVRRVTATIASGAVFWPSMISPTEGAQREPSTEGGIRFTYELADPPPALDSGDPLGQVTITIIGNDVRSNESAATYQYFAFCDPGGRFSHVGSIHHGTGTTTQTMSLYRGQAQLTDWESVWGFFNKMVLGASTSNGLWLKGIDSSSNASAANGTSVTGSAITFGDGELTTQSAFHFSAGSNSLAIPFILFRANDWTEENGKQVLQVFSYTGDGGSARTIMLSPTGQRPLWAMIKGSNAAAIFRDSSHTGTTSSQIGTGGALTANASTGITGGGIDTLTVGSALNSNGIVYECLVFMGGECNSGNGGWSCNDVFEPIEPAEPPCYENGSEVDCPCDNTDLDETNDCGDCDDCECVDDDCSCVGPDCEPPECDPEVEDCDTIDPPCEGEGCVEFGDQCITESQKVCNQALSNIGISEIITDLANDTSVEAQQCRLHYDSSVNELLEEFPWDFATKYADLQWLAGSEDSIDDHYNKDWIYSYRLPTDYIAARRIVRPDLAREHDDSPPMFRQDRNDTTGKRLVTNYFDPLWEATEDRPVQVTLEYTYKPTCVASHADALARQALAWLLASKLAPSIARNKMTAQDCIAMFQFYIGKARAKNANKQQQSVVFGDASWITERD